MASNPAEFLRKWFEEVWNQRNENRIREWVTPDCVCHGEGGDINGPDEFITLFHRQFLAAFPDMHITVHEVVGDGTRAVARWTFSGTHSKEFFGVPASGRKLQVSGMSWVRMKGDRFAEAWDSWNMTGLMSALRDGTATANVSLI